MGGILAAASGIGCAAFGGWSPHLAVDDDSYSNHGAVVIANREGSKRGPSFPCTFAQNMGFFYNGVASGVLSVRVQLLTSM